MARPSIRDLNLEPAPVPFPSRPPLPALTERPLELQAEGWGQQVAALQMRATEAEVRVESLRRQLDAANDRNDFLEDRLGKETARADRYQRQVNRVEAVAEGMGSQLLTLLDTIKADKPTAPVDEQKIERDMAEFIALTIDESDDVAERG